MASPPRSPVRAKTLKSLLSRDHSLNGGILFGLDGRLIEIQARAISVLRQPMPWSAAVSLTGMAPTSVREAMGRLSGAFAKLQIPEPEVEVLINLAPADLVKHGTWLDLPLATRRTNGTSVLKSRSMRPCQEAECGTSANSANEEWSSSSTRSKKAAFQPDLWTGSRRWREPWR